MRINRKKLICLMLEKEINNNQLSALSGVSRNTISSVKNGKSCSDVTLGKIAQALKVPVEKLIDISESN